MVPTPHSRRYLETTETMCQERLFVAPGNFRVRRRKKIPMTAAQRRINARIGGLELHAQGDSFRIAARARKGLEQSFRKRALEIDPTLHGSALDSKIEILKSLHYTRLAKKSAQSRARRVNR